jgi:AcrR family transcriptional regulator
MGDYDVSEVTDSHASPGGGKRQRLVRSATDLVHRDGVDTPTLARVAQTAGVPPGNVYYYFKTRDELLGAVVDARVEGLHQLLEALDAQPDPRVRLTSLAHTWDANRDDIAANGCPLGSLCSELNKRGRGLDERAATLLVTGADWLTEQFRQLGHHDARDLAMTMLATVQGAALLSNTLRDPEILTTQIRRLDRWLDTLVPDAEPTEPADRRTP